VQEELRHGSTSTSQQQGVGDGDEGDLAFLVKGKEKTRHGVLETGNAFLVARWGTMLENVPRRRRSKVVLQRQQRRMSSLQRRRTIETPSNSWCIDKVEEVPQIQSGNSRDLDSVIEYTIFKGGWSTCDNFSFKVAKYTDNWCRCYMATYYFAEIYWRALEVG
jgi:hypothetical protein